MGNSIGKVYRDVINYEDSSQSIEYGKDNFTEKKKKYRIAVSQDGKFAVTFDTDVLDSSSQNKSDEPFDNDKTIAYFKIDNDFEFSKLYNPKKTEDSSGNGKTTKHDKSSSEEDEKNDNYKWSFDISNMHKNDNDDSEYFIFVTISRININEDMKQEKRKKMIIKSNDGYLNKIRFKPLFNNNDKSVETIISMKPEFKKKESKKGSLFITLK
ncbi:uncharacterized protein OCT59_015572 [Rhizophagus irregularis]|uniref:uncharacterized protein n=1 Tax=Rhizophagus irregularis TaxID=588596 RepID=UPI0019ED9E6D|nr:hypothetical protein OCT59_015572 [Rhizophagus irregularis]GBC18466.2 hypothetical protein GLOIN_2v1846755 [Rhizophagus irregularis DAOM 181602=DAOM 197198]